VIVFFVLSGYLITAVATEREARLRTFVVSRAARIYSVALPALALTASVDLILLAQGRTDGVPFYQYAAPHKYLPLFLGFATDLWFMREDAFSNLPYWSLCYEVWYYALFAAIHFGRGRLRVLLVAAILLVIGPRLWLLLPVWGLGSLVYRRHRRGALGVMTARLLFAASLLAIVALKLCAADVALNSWVAGLIGPDASAALRYSRYFAGDYLLAALLALNLWGARDAGLAFGRLAPIIAYGAGFTFTLYLVHYPLLELIAGSFAPPPVVLAGTVLAAAWAIGLFTERQKARWRLLFDRALDRVWRAPASMAPLRSARTK
jgi:peptidoglycan/LPS O-acetylase OafA/YrhL